MALLGLLSLYPHEAIAAKKKIKIKDPSRVSTVSYEGGTVDCYLNKKSVWKPGKLSKSGKIFRLDNKKKALAGLKLKLKNETDSKKKKKIRKRLAKKRKRFKDRKVACQGGSSGDDDDDGPAPPAPDAVSLSKLDRALTTADVLYLIEKAGYGGRNPGLEALAGSGIDAVVDNFFIVHPENYIFSIGGVGKSTERWVEDWLDNNLNNETPATEGDYDDPLIPTLDGMRRALITLTLNTRNPLRVRLLHMFLRVFSVNACKMSSSGDDFPGPDPRQNGTYWEYIQLLSAASKAPDLVSTVQNVGQSVAMLVSHGNNENDKDDPSELYAQELMDRFTIGATRTDSNGNQVLNYSRNTIDGSGTRNDDLAKVARRLTGHSVALEPTGVGGEFTWQRGFTPSEHAEGPETIFEGTSYAFAPDESLNGLFVDTDLVSKLITLHPGSAENWARIVLEEFVTLNPPIELVTEFAQLIRDNGYNLDIPLKVLFKSKAFYYEGYKDTIPKSPLEVMVEAIRTLKIHDYVNDQLLGQLENDITRTSKSAQSSNYGMNFDFLCPMHPHFFPREMFKQGGPLAVNLLFIARYVEYAQDHEENDIPTLWEMNDVLPGGALSPVQLIQTIASVLRVEVSADQQDMLEFFLNFVIGNSPEGYIPYDNTVDEDPDERILNRRGKGMTLFTLLMGYPGFTLR